MGAENLFETSGTISPSKRRYISEDLLPQQSLGVKIMYLLSHSFRLFCLIHSVCFLQRDWFPTKDWNDTLFIIFGYSIYIGEKVKDHLLRKHWQTSQSFDSAIYIYIYWRNVNSLAYRNVRNLRSAELSVTVLITSYANLAHPWSWSIGIGTSTQR